MTPKSFVTALVASVRQSAEGEADYFAAPQSNRPPDHLTQFATWFQRLSPADQGVAREVMQYVAEGSLFGLFTYLDNISFLTDEGGTLELWHTSQGGSSVRLNDPDGELLTDLFNDRAEPDAQADGGID